MKTQTQIAKPTYEQLELENRNLKESMEVIRFLSFNHEVTYWAGASGTDGERLHSILILSREANWCIGGVNRSKKIRQKHS